MTTLTIGNFDGLHLGHRAVLEKMRGGIAITFSNHPASILRKISPLQLVTLSHKLQLLRESGVEPVILPFTEQLSMQSPEEFLKEIRSLYPFSRLVLGHDARLGRDRSGTPELLSSLAYSMGFSLEYIPPFTLEGEIVSSSKIRARIAAGDLGKASRFLGRPYSIRSTVVEGTQRARLLGFKTANIPVEGLALPPFGVYVSQVLFKGIRYKGIANLGVAPTLHTHTSPRLEVHILDFSDNLYGVEIEVELHNYLRPERRFSSLEALREAIAQDIAHARGIH